MPRNITLSISDDVAVQMEAMPEVNWSSVARTSIVQYIELRKNPDLSALIEKLQRQKGEEYVKGRVKADEIADNLGYPEVDILTKKYWKEMEEVIEKDYTGYEPQPWDTAPTTPETIIQKLLIERKLVESDVSTEFARGFRERLIQIEEAIQK